MTDFFKVILLACIQGVTEFLPVSSSGHLVLGKHLLGLNSTGVLLEVVLHAGTLLSILIYYRTRLIRLLKETLSGRGDGRAEFLAIVVGSIPAFAAYALFHAQLEPLFESPRAASLCLLVTGAVLLSLRLCRSQDRPITLPRGFMVGVGQAFALLPGISRSGSTIAVARHLGISPARAAEFSLLLAILPLTAAAALKAWSMRGGEVGAVGAGSLLVGLLVSATVGYAAIVLLVRLLRTNRLWLFGPYCLLLGSLGLVLI